MSDDASLLAAVEAGSEQAFNELIDRHQQSLRAFLRGLVAIADADDIAQETFLVVWEKSQSYRGAANFRSWLFAIGWRKAKDSQRRWFRRRERESAYHLAHSNQTNLSASMEDVLSVRQALLSLPLDQRAAIQLCLGAGFTHVEASETLDIPLGTVKSYVSRGREKLRQALGVEE